MEQSSPKAIIMDEVAVSRAIKRIAHEIVERNEGCEDLALVGIVTRGDLLAKELARQIEEIEGVKVPLGRLDISFYRDDYLTHFSPEVHATDIPFDVNDKRIVLVDDISVGIQVADQYAAEHLEIHTENARAVAEQITNAGAIFVGDFSPVPLGDYSAGSNHVLPTSGTARFSAGLSTHTFLRPVNLIEYDEAALKDISDVVINFANAEDLPAHGEAIRARFETLPTNSTEAEA